MRLRKRKLVAKFFTDRGTHLAAMIAYFALLSFVPLLFLTLSLLGFAGRADESSYLVTELSHAFPESSVATLIKIVQTLQDNAAAFGIVGAVVLVWTSLSLFSVLESALNIVYGRPNRGFLRGKSLALAFMVGTLAMLFFGLIVASVGDSMLKRYAPGVTGNGVAAYAISVLISAFAVFLFLASIYRLLPNVADMTVREVLPGTLAATVLLEVTLPDPAAVHPLLEPQPDAARLQRRRPAARLALRDGERDRDRRRGELVGGAARGRRRGAAGLERSEQRARGAGAVRVPGLPLVPELGDRPRLALRERRPGRSRSPRCRAAPRRSSPRARRCRAPPRPPARWQTSSQT